MVSAGLGLGLTGCGSDPIVCRDRPDDTTGYLKPICEHLRSEYGTYRIDPNELEIASIKPGDESLDAFAPYDNADYDWVRLSCCYTGDVAVIHRATVEVVTMRFGDK